MTSPAAQNTADMEIQDQGISLEEYKRSSRRDAISTVLWGLVIMLPRVILFIVVKRDFSDLFESLFFIIGLFFLASGIWQYIHATRLTVEDLNKYNEAREFSVSLEKTPIIYSKVILGCLIVVAVFQLIRGVEESIKAAGLIKNAVWEGESWRLLTGFTLHGNFLHILINGVALIGLGRLVESLKNRAYVAIVFLLSAACGSIFGLLLMPHSTSVGASGGLMGLVGFLAVLGYRFKERLPSGFFKSIMINIFIIGIIGLAGYDTIDNAGHLGGLVAGVVSGVLVIKEDDHPESTLVSKVIRGLGRASLIIIAGISLFSIVTILKW